MKDLGCFSDIVDCFTDLRDELGFGIADVFIVERQWRGERIGDGPFTDKIEKMPTPEIRDLSHDVRVSEAGAYKSGDLILRNISKDRFEEDELRTDTGVDNKEKFIKVGNHFYRTIHIKERLVTWEIHIRKVAQDETERR